MISPVEIETCLRRMPSVRDCAVVPVPDAIVGDEIKAVLVCDGAVEPASVCAFLKDLLPSYMLPRYVEFLDSIPKTETEKIQRNKLQDLNDCLDAAGPNPGIAAVSDATGGIGHPCPCDRWWCWPPFRRSARLHTAARGCG